MEMSMFFASPCVSVRLETFKANVPSAGEVKIGALLSLEVGALGPPVVPPRSQPMFHTRKLESRSTEASLFMVGSSSRRRKSDFTPCDVQEMTPGLESEQL